MSNGLRGYSTRGDFATPPPVRPPRGLAVSLTCAVAYVVNAFTQSAPERIQQVHTGPQQHIPQDFLLYVVSSGASVMSYLCREDAETADCGWKGFQQGGLTDCSPARYSKYCVG